MTVEAVLFWAFGACVVIGAAAVIASRNAVNSAMALVATFFFLAGIYLLLWAPTLAVLQVLVYAGAIMVLFLFVIMLLSLAESEVQGGRITLSRVLGGAAAAAVLWALETTLLRLAPVARAMATAPAPQFGTLKSLGALLYSQYVLPFEVVSLLLLVAIVGAVVVAKSRI